MKKEDRQIVWDDCEGYYKEQKLFLIVKPNKFACLYFLINREEILIMCYGAIKSAKRGAERFLKRLQEAVK